MWRFEIYYETDNRETTLNAVSLSFFTDTLIGQKIEMRLQSFKTERGSALYYDSGSIVSASTFHKRWNERHGPVTLPLDRPHSIGLCYMDRRKKVLPTPRKFVRRL